MLPPSLSIPSPYSVPCFFFNLMTSDTAHSLMMFLTASSDSMQLDASCLSLFLLSLRRKPWMLKGTLCSGEKPQQFVLCFLDKSSSENSLPSMWSPSMTIFPSWCVFVSFWFGWGFFCLLWFGFFCFIFCVRLCVRLKAFCKS